MGTTAFMVGEPPLRGSGEVRVVDIGRDLVSPPIKVGSILAQAAPGDWQKGPGPDAEAAREALELAT